MTRWFITLALVLGAAVVHAQEPSANTTLQARKIRGAIDRAIAYMGSKQSRAGSVGAQYPQGATCLSALAFMASGRHSSSDAALSAMLEYLAKSKTRSTYERGLRANVWEYALRQQPGNERYRELLRAELDWLMKALGDRPGWRYNDASRDWDNSCTQYGVLGVWAATRAGMQPSEGFWGKLSKHFRDCQNDDGGWGYTRGGSSPNMVTAGLASLYLVFDNHYTREPFRRDVPRRFAEGEAAEVLSALARAQEWLAKRGQPWGDGYYLYGIERCGVASGEKLLGGADWFARGAQTILRAQRPDGSIPIGRHGGGLVNTAFCTLFLLNGGAPLTFYKLDHREGQDDDLNPRDLANLTRNLWVAYERPVNWQKVSLKASLGELLEAPVVFLSGTLAVSIDAKGVAKLRDYVLSGGTLLAEPSDRSPEFARSIEGLLRRMFPEDDYPSYGFKKLESDHGVYSGLEWEQRPRLQGASDGSRTFFFLSEDYLSAEWQAGLRDGDAFQFARSLLYYVRGDQGLRERFSTVVPKTPPAPVRETVLRVGRVAYGGGAEHPRDWDAARMSWRTVAPYLRHVSGVGVAERTVHLGQDDLAKVDLLHITGRHALALTPNERAALVGFAQRGGTLLVDAFCGAPKFAASARAELEKLFGELRPLSPGGALSLGVYPGGANLSRGITLKGPAFERAVDAGKTIGAQDLLVGQVNGRVAVVFSELDLSAALAGIESFGAIGYVAESARQIVANVAGHVLSR